MNTLQLAKRSGLAIVFSVGCSLSAYAQTVTYNGGGFSIPDRGQATSTIRVIPPTPGRAVRQAYVSLNGLSHTYAGDLSGNIRFSSRQADIFQNQGNGADISGNYSFADTAPNAPFGTQSTSAGAYRPFTPFSVFNGVSAFGDWTLSISDNGAGDTGQFDSWTLYIDYGAAAPEPSSWAFMILGFGIVGGTLRRRKRVGSPQRSALAAA